MAIKFENCKFMTDGFNIKAPETADIHVSGSEMQAKVGNVIITAECPLITDFAVRPSYAPMLRAFQEANPQTEAEAVELAERSGLQRFLKAGKTIAEVGRFLWENKDWLNFMVERGCNVGSP